MMLKTTLDLFRADFLTKVPADTAAMMEKATLQLTQEFISAPLLQVGDRALAIELPNALGNLIKPSDRLQQGPVI